MSARALAYSNELLAHRFIVLYEAAGHESDFGCYLMRSLLSEGRIRYETVETTSDGMQPPRDRARGPDGVIVTTTAITLHPDNETRCSRSGDGQAHTDEARVARARLRAVEMYVDLDAWQAVDTWMILDEHEVTIPYADALAEAIPPVAVRLRRDFGAVLNLIRTHAVLHQGMRGRDGGGRIIATLDDYAVVRDLVADLVSDGVGATVPATVREAVEAVGMIAPLTGDETTNSAIASHLRLDKSAASRRVSAAIDCGFRRNLEDWRGRPARIVLGDKLPAEVDILPSIEVLRGCAVAGGGVTTPLPPTCRSCLSAPCCDHRMKARRSVPRAPRSGARRDGPARGVARRRGGAVVMDGAGDRLRPARSDCALGRGALELPPRT